MTESASGDPSQSNLKVDLLANLASIVSPVVGMRVDVLEDGWSYISLGSLSVEISDRLGWQVQPVWMPSHVLHGITTKHAAIADLVLTAAMILRNPTSIHSSLRSASERYFFIDADALRAADLLNSGSIRSVDAVVELRYVTKGEIVRLFHLSPATRNKGGKQLWP